MQKESLISHCRGGDVEGTSHSPGQDRKRDSLHLLKSENSRSRVGGTSQNACTIFCIMSFRTIAPCRNVLDWRNSLHLQGIEGGAISLSHWWLDAKKCDATRLVKKVCTIHELLYNDVEDVEPIAGKGARRERVFVLFQLEINLALSLFSELFVWTPRSITEWLDSG